MTAHEQMDACIQVIVERARSAYRRNHRFLLGSLEHVSSLT